MDLSINNNLQYCLTKQHLLRQNGFTWRNLLQEEEERDEEEELVSYLETQ